MSDTKKSEYKLLIKFIFKRNRRYLFKFKEPSSLIQNEPFKMGLRIKNIDDKTLQGFIIKDLKIEPADRNVSLSYSFEEKFLIDVLNSDQSIEVWWPNTLTTFLKGWIWTSCSVIPGQPKKEKIQTYQYHNNTKSTDECEGFNKWGNDLYVTGRFELQQLRISKLLLVFTLLTLLILLMNHLT